MSIKTFKYETWQQFLRDYKRDLYTDGIFKYGEFVFRGQRCADWKLKSSFDREYGHYPWQQRKTIEKDLLEHFWTNSKRIIESSKLNCLKDEEKKIIAQHYGLPTRLLDWSYSPFVAAYFAYEKIRTNDGYVAIWALKKDHEIWNSDIGVQIEEKIVLENERQKRQLGCFTILNSPQQSIDDFEEDCERQDKDTDNAIYKLILPCSEWHDVLSELLAMNISASTIFGGFEGCALAAKTEVELELK